MSKIYLLMPFLALTIAVSASENPVNRKLINPLLSCAEIPTVTVLHPNCESPVTGMVEVTWPVQGNQEYSIDGINYQLDPVFLNVLPGTYSVTYRNISTGCTSEPNDIVMDGSLAVGTIEPTSESILTSQIICINTAMETITYVLGGVAETATVSGLPAGVTGVFADNIFTISGTPTNSGVYSYTVTTSGGTCPAVANGTLTVRLNAAIVWMSSSGARNQTLCQGAALNQIRYIIANGATGAVTDGLPVGLSGTFSDGVFAISGTPETSGVYNYSVTTTGGCSTAVSTGTLTVNAAPIVNLECNPEGSDLDSMAFDWMPVSGASTYNYSYQINDGPLVSGSVSSNSHFTVEGVSAGQSVSFTITSVNGPAACFSPQSVTCEMQPLSSAEFDIASFSYYPNPVQHLLHLENDTSFQNITVFDLVGKIVIDKIVSGNQLELDMSQLNSGLYIVKATTAKGSQSFKVTKQ